MFARRRRHPILTTSASANIRPLNEVDPSMVSYGLWSLFVNTHRLGTAKKAWDSFLADFTHHQRRPRVVAYHGGISGGDQALRRSSSPWTSRAPAASHPEQWGLGDVAGIRLDRYPVTTSPRSPSRTRPAPTCRRGTASMTAALQAAPWTPTTNLVAFTANPSDQAAYPIPTMSYLIVPTSGLSRQGQALAAFIRFVLGPGPVGGGVLRRGTAHADHDHRRHGRGPTVAAEAATARERPPPAPHRPRRLHHRRRHVPRPTSATAAKTSTRVETGVRVRDGERPDASVGSRHWPSPAEMPGWVLTALGALAVVAGEVARRELRRPGTSSFDWADSP